MVVCWPLHHWGPVQLSPPSPKTDVTQKCMAWKIQLLSCSGWKYCEKPHCAGADDEGDDLRRCPAEASLCFSTRNKRIVSFHAPSDGPAWPGLRARQWPDMDTWKKYSNVKVKRRKLMSPWHWFFLFFLNWDSSQALLFIWLTFPTY